MPSEKRDGEIFVGVWLEIRDALKEISTEALVEELKSRQKENHELPAREEKKQEKKSSPDASVGNLTQLNDKDNDLDDDYDEPDKDERIRRDRFRYGWNRQEILMEANEGDVEDELLHRFGFYDSDPSKMEKGCVIRYDSLQEQYLYEKVDELYEKVGAQKILDILESL